MLLALAATLGGVLLLMALAVDSLGTSLDRDDFDSEGEARQFVSEHVPAPLPASAAVRELTYERWTDWHLGATVVMPGPGEATTYLAATTRERVVDESYCGPADATDGVPYFLKKWMACGSVKAGTKPTELVVRCFTR